MVKRVLAGLALALLVASPVMAVDTFHPFIVYDNGMCPNNSAGSEWKGQIDGPHAITQEYTACDHFSNPVERDNFRVLLWSYKQDSISISVETPSGALLTPHITYDGKVKSYLFCDATAEIGTYTVHLSGQTFKNATDYLSVQAGGWTCG